MFLSHLAGITFEALKDGGIIFLFHEYLLSCCFSLLLYLFPAGMELSQAGNGFFSYKATNLL